MISNKMIVGIVVATGFLASVFIIVLLLLPTFLPILLPNIFGSPGYVNADHMAHFGYGSNDYFLLNKSTKNFERGDLIVFKSASGAAILDRIVGLPLEKVEIKDGSLFINGAVLKESYLPSKIAGTQSITLGSDEYFVLGGNDRMTSFDSRGLGAIKKSSILGKVISHSRRAFMNN